ncbi:N-acetylmuramidase domain-containing protein [Paraburkholderia sediminicola]|uniref:N-acetylmuramidase domain-containing protein n=1 Tax=Paraburkholderia sediminicola TaxID=458836 RepID=UPI0038B91A62
MNRGTSVVFCSQRARLRLCDRSLQLRAIQIMGLHWLYLDYPSASDFAASMNIDERSQLDAFVRFIERDAAMLRAFRRAPT